MHLVCHFLSDQPDFATDQKNDGQFRSATFYYYNIITFIIVLFIAVDNNTNAAAELALIAMKKAQLIRQQHAINEVGLRSEDDRTDHSLTFH